MPELTLGITGLHELLGRDYGIEEPYWGPSIGTLMQVLFTKFVYTPIFLLDRIG